MKTFLTRFLPGALIAGAITAIGLLIHLPGLWGTVWQELGRGAAAMPFGGLAASLGVVAVEEALLFENFRETALRLILLTAPHIALGLLWQRYRWKGELAALVEHLAWNQWFASPYWLIPTAGMGAIYLKLLFHKEQKPV